MVSSYTHFYLLHNYTAVCIKIIFNSNQNLKKNYRLIDMTDSTI